jgi:L-iditol 2-dehydrogenase
MKVVQITGKERAEIAEVPDPKAKGEFVVVKITSSPMCTEYKVFKSGGPAKGLGHEAAGVVVEAAQHNRVKPGDRVVVMPQIPCGKCPLCLDGEYIHCEHTLDLERETGYAHGAPTYAQYIVKQDWLLLPIPEGMSDDHASMACCGLGPTFGAMELMGVDAYDTLLITGLGPVGLGGVINGVHRGARVIGVEGNAYRAALGRSLGAEAVLDPGDAKIQQRLRELTGGLGVDKAVDCTGVQEAQRILIEGTRRKGEVAFVGEGGELPIKVSDDMIRKGLTLRGSWHYPLHETAKIMRIVRETEVSLDKLITHRFPMDEAQKAFELQLTGKCGKVVLHPWEG